MNKPIIKILNYYETHEAEGGTEQIAWEIEQVFKGTDNKEIGEILHKHVPYPFLTEAVNEISQKLKQKDDYYKGIIKEMLGKKANRIDYSSAEDLFNGGYNEKREEGLKILSKHKIDIK